MIFSLLLVALIAYCAVGLGLLWLSKDHRQRVYQGPSSLSSLLEWERETPELPQGNEGMLARFRPYAVVARTVVRAVLGWPKPALVRWSYARDELAVFDIKAAHLRESMRGSYVGELPPGRCPATFGALWNASIPPAAQGGLPRFIHFRHAVVARDEAIGVRGVTGTLVRDGDGYSGGFTLHGHSRGRTLPEQILPVSLPAAAVRALLDALRPVRLLREVPPQYAPNYQAPRFTLVRRLAVSAPTGCAPGLFELAAESGSRAGARWDCVRHGGWAVDSVHARQNNPAWLTAGGVDAAWENLIDGMGLRRHLPRLPEGVAGWFMRTLD